MLFIWSFCMWMEEWIYVHTCGFVYIPTDYNKSSFPAPGPLITMMRYISITAGPGAGQDHRKSEMFTFSLTDWTMSITCLSLIHLFHNPSIFRCKNLFWKSLLRKPIYTYFVFGLKLPLLAIKWNKCQAAPYLRKSVYICTCIKSSIQPFGSRNRTKTNPKSFGLKTIGSAFLSSD